MPFFSKTYNGLADALITDAIIVETTEVTPGQPLPKYFYTNNAAWDTGSEVTIISQKVIDHLGLKPAGTGVMMGIGGDQQGATYIIQVGLPNGDIINDVEAFSGDILVYEVLIAGWMS